MRYTLGVILIAIFTLSIHAQEDRSEFDQRKYTKEKKLIQSISVEFNMGIGILDVESVTMAGIQTTYGFKLKDQVTIGIGTGLHLYESERFLPLFCEFRYLPGKGPTKLMVGGSFGTYYGWEQGEWDRYINPFLGFSHQTFDHVEFTFSIGLTFKEYDIRKEPVRLPGGGFSNISGTQEVLGRFFSVRFGCRF